MSSPKQVLLIDGDLMIFSICAAAEYGKSEEDMPPFSSIAQAIDSKIRFLAQRCEADEVRCFLTKGNFRPFIMPNYKSNRVDVWRPYNLKNAQAHLTAYHDAEVVYNLEADDLMALAVIEEKARGNIPTIATLDKDLLQISCNHYRWETHQQGEKFTTVKGLGELIKKEFDRDETGKKKPTKFSGVGSLFFCYQLLIGDSTDGIIGCGERVPKVYKTGAKAGQSYEKREGVGATEAYDLLHDSESYGEALERAIGKYQEYFGERWEEMLLMQGRCLYMTRELVDNKIRLWHYSDTREWLDLHTGEITLEE